MSRTKENFSGGTVAITGVNVRMRSQPNTQANILGAVSKNEAWNFPEYLGEWTNHQGDKWVAANFRDDDDDIKTVWIFGQYTSLVKKEQARASNMTHSSSLIEEVRNNFYFKNYTADLGYNPVGKQPDLGVQSAA